MEKIQSLNLEMKRDLPGLWLGIDLGTTNTTAAFYSSKNHVAKLMRFAPQYAAIQKKNGKYGKILPSTVYYENGVIGCIGNSALMKKQNNSKDDNSHDVTKTCVCTTSATNNDKEPSEHSKTNNTSLSNNHGVLLTSVKRIWGMDTAQIKNEIYMTVRFGSY